MAGGVGGDIEKRNNLNYRGNLVCHCTHWAYAVGKPIWKSLVNFNHWQRCKMYYWGGQARGGVMVYLHSWRINFKMNWGLLIHATCQKS